jgi:hypothetical protein
MTDKNKLLAFSSEKSDNSNYINLPESYLKKIIDDKIKEPYYFSLLSPYGIKTWVGVRQFTADEDTVNIPRWIMDHLCMFENSQKIVVELEKDIPKGKKAIIEPQQEDFFSINDYDACLEQILSDYCILHRNQLIEITLFDKKYYLLIKDVEIDWSSVNYDSKNINEILSEGVIDIKNIDLTVDIKNKFLKNLEESKSKKLKNDKSDSNDKLNDNNSEDKNLDNKKFNSKGLKMCENHSKLDKDGIRNARLKYYNNKFGIEI